MKWRTLTVRSRKDTVSCALALPVNRAAALVIVPFKSKEAVEHPTPSHWKWLPSENLVELGVGVLVVHCHLGDFIEISRILKDGDDHFSREVERVRSVVHYARDERLSEQNRLVLAGTSRHGYLSLLAAAYIEEISGAIPVHPVTHWPKLKEFAGMEGNPILEKHELRRLTGRFPPRRILFICGYDDRRVGTEYAKSLADKMRESYRKRGMEDRFTFDIHPVPGHDKGYTEKTFACSRDAILDWLPRQGFV